MSRVKYCCCVGRDDGTLSLLFTLEDGSKVGYEFLEDTLYDLISLAQPFGLAANSLFDLKQFVGLDATAFTSRTGGTGKAAEPSTLRLSGPPSRDSPEADNDGASRFLIDGTYRSLE